MAVWVIYADFNLDCRFCGDEQKVERGCVEDTPIPGAWVIAGEEYNQCPLRLITPQSAEYLRAYYFFKSGRDPVSGGFNEQAAKYTEAMLLIDRVVREIDEERRKHEKR